MIALQEKVAAFDAVNFKSVFCITSCYPATGPNLNPMALGTRWLAYADRKVSKIHVNMTTKCMPCFFFNMLSHC